MRLAAHTVFVCLFRVSRTNGYKSACPSPDDSENILPPAEGSDGELREAVVDHVSCWDDSPAELSNLLTVDELKNDDSQRKCAAPLATQVGFSFCVRDSHVKHTGHFRTLPVICQWEAQKVSVQVSASLLDSWSVLVKEVPFQKICFLFSKHF